MPGSTPPPQAFLVLEDGSVFHGRPWGATGKALGTINFSTAMVGYQQVITDPARHGQLLVMTYPHIGNVGMNDLDSASGAIEVAGLIARDPARVASNWQARTSLEEDLVAQDIVGLCDIDTRALTKKIRSGQSLRAGIFSGDAVPELPGELGVQDMLNQVLNYTPLEGSADAS